MTASADLARQPLDAASGEYFEQDSPELSIRTEQDLPHDSLARRTNWPAWAREHVGSLSGLAALELLAQSERSLYFLGSPFLDDVEVLEHRVSKYTGEQGEYVTEEGPPKTTVISIPKAASMRAIINRFGMSSYVSDIDERCWSGWYPYRGNVQPISTSDMVAQAQQDPFLRFVAAIDISRIDPADIHDNMHDQTFAVDLRGQSVSSVRPDLIVPVTGRRDLPAEMLVIDETSVARAEAETVYDWLWRTNGDQKVPPKVTIETTHGRRDFRLRRLGQLTVAQSEGA